MDQSLHHAVTDEAPRFTRRPKRVIVLLGAKLIGLDAVLPVAMALKAEDSTLDIVFLFLSEDALPSVERNYVLRRGVEKTGRVAILSTGRSGVARKLRAALRLVHWCLRALAAPTWLLCYSDAAQFPIRPLACAVRRRGGGVLLYAKAAHPGNDVLTRAHRSLESRQGVDMKFTDPGDVLLLYHPDQARDYADFAEGRSAVIGSPRSYPEWYAHLDNMSAEIGLCNAEDRPIDLSRRPLLALFYSGDVHIPTQTDRPRETLSRILSAIAQETPGATVLIKPHPNCDLDQLADDIAPFAALDLHVTHAHPQIVARAATAAIFNNGSYAMNDVYAEGTTIIEASAYHLDVLEIGDSLFPNPGRIDGSTPEGLCRALRLAADDPDALPAPDSSPLVWPKPASLFGTLCSQ